VKPTVVKPIARRVLPAGLPGVRADLTEDGPDTRHWVLEGTEWAALGAQRIARLGITWGTTGYLRVRVMPSGSFVMAACAGSGRVLLDGAWRTVGRDTACMAPPRVLNAFAARPGHPWVLAWIRYDEPAPGRAMVGATSPQQVSFPGENLLRLMQGLRAEWDGLRDPQCLGHWLELIQATARRLAQPAPVDPAFAENWEKVGRLLGARWDLEHLCAHFGSSRERLRQACLKEYGRSPMEHLTSMRMQAARHRLVTTPDKLDAIARDLGYDSGLVFARAFRRWTGCTPTEFRRR
jgi:AraC-like DNA-binding protein